uniref:Uncharacterized protein n=1 Tax=Rhizophora mucronata TaxID=61149 RepID=A0A2P2IJ51_RHIMU
MLLLDHLQIQQQKYKQVLHCNTCNKGKRWKQVR